MKEEIEKIAKTLFEYHRTDFSSEEDVDKKWEKLPNDYPTKFRNMLDILDLTKKDYRKMAIGVYYNYIEPETVETFKYEHIVDDDENLLEVEVTPTEKEKIETDIQNVISILNKSAKSRETRDLY